jgi:carbonic anhydrase
MRLFEAIIEANHRAAAGDRSAGLHPGDFADELPVIALTCIDPRLNALFPNALGLPADQFIWLRNAGNIIFDPMSSMTRTLALACAVKGGREIAIIGHTDCHVGQTTTIQLLERFRALGIERAALPDNLNEFFGMFSSERQNVIKACDIVRRSPLIGPRIPVHGLMVDVETGKLDWIVNGYETLGTVAGKFTSAIQSADEKLSALESLADFKIGDLKFPETKIGEAIDTAHDWLQKAADVAEAIGAKKMADAVPKAAPPATPPKIPLPRPIRMKMDFRNVKR